MEAVWKQRRNRYGCTVKNLPGSRDQGRTAQRAAWVAARCGALPEIFAAFDALLHAVKMRAYPP